MKKSSYRLQKNEIGIYSMYEKSIEEFYLDTCYFTCHSYPLFAYRRTVSVKKGADAYRACCQNQRRGSERDRDY